MSSQLKIIGAAVILAALCFLLGRWSAPQHGPVEAESVRVDTLVVRDTITRYRPEYRTNYVRDSIFVTLTERDTVYVSLPREVRVYEDKRYRAEVSGYQPSLDRIDIYEQERVVTQHSTQVVSVKKPTRWGLGVQVGYGMTIEKTPSWTPYVGVGLSYNLISW